MSSEKTQLNLFRIAELLKLNPDFPLLSSEAALYLRVVPGTLPVWRSQGKGPRYALVNSQIRYFKADLDEFIASCKTRRVVSPDVGRPVKKRRGRRR